MKFFFFFNPVKLEIKVGKSGLIVFASYFIMFWVLNTNLKLSCYYCFGKYKKKIQNKKKKTLKIVDFLGFDLITYKVTFNTNFTLY